MLRRVRVLVATLWVGSLWTVGYLVAPTLFATLADRVLAGTIAGSLFRVEAWLSVACGLILFGVLWRTSVAAVPARTLALRLVLGMLLCTVLGYFGLQPFMAAIRESAALAGGMDADARLRFGVLHGAASGIFLLQSLLGLALVLKMRSV